MHLLFEVIEAGRARSIENRTNQWIYRQVQLFSQRRFEEIDIEGIAKEADSMDDSEKRDLVMFLKALLMRLLTDPPPSPR